MKLTSMKLDAAEQKKESEMVVDKPKFPCGLNFSLNEDAIDKLGIKTLPSVDEEYTLTASVRVSGVSDNDYGNGKNRNISLQITAMTLGDAEKESNTEGTLYDKSAKA